MPWPFSQLVTGGHQQNLSSGHLTLNHPTKVTSRIAKSFFFRSSTPGDSKCPFHPLVGGHLTPSKGHFFTIPKRVTLNHQAVFFFLFQLASACLAAGQVMNFLDFGGGTELEVGVGGVTLRWVWNMSGWWFFKDFLFSPPFGEDEPILTHIFQRGWFNHQPDMLFCSEKTTRF